MMTAQELDNLAYRVIGCSIEVHRRLKGPGLLESTYEKCLCRELIFKGIHAERQIVLPIKYRDIEVENAYRIDLLIEGELIIELKAVEKVLPVHKAQLLTYLRLADKRLGLLINFHVEKLTNGVTRMVNNF